MFFGGLWLVFCLSLMKRYKKNEFSRISSEIRFQVSRGSVIKLIKANLRALRYPYDYYNNDSNGSMPSSSLSKTKQNSIVPLSQGLYSDVSSILHASGTCVGNDMM